MASKSFDVAIIGGGIAGASVGAFLAEFGVKGGLFEMEDTLAYHTTGRSAALFTPNYGPDSIRAFATYARTFFDNPPLEVGQPILEPKSLLTLVQEHQSLEIERPPGGQWVDQNVCLDAVPFLKNDMFIGGIIDHAVSTIDVHALHSLYLRMFKNNGGVIMPGSGVKKLWRKSEVWEIETANGTYEAPIIVNAAGAWGDHVAQMANLSPVGLIPKRRTCVVVNEEQFNNVRFDELPYFVVVEHDYLYFQNFGAGKLMFSPSDQTPSNPCDAQPDEIDIAIGISRFEDATTLKVRSVDHSWAGLRTFATDRHPVIGWEPFEDGFFWLVGQGGYGIFTSPAIGRYAASLVSESSQADEFKNDYFDFDNLSPNRFRLT